MTDLIAPTDEVGATAVPDCPYKGLESYTEADGDYFFGRDTARDLVIANLMANRLTILYGPSGVGKSSLLQAGVVRQLRRTGGEVFSYLATDTSVVAYAAAWHGDPLAELGAALLRVVPDASEVSDLIVAQSALSVQLLQELSTRLDADIYLLLDQFEELALYQTGPAGAAFDAELGRILGTPGLRVSVLLGVRDDALATIDRLEAYVPGLFDNRLSLEHLSRDGGRAAIEQPLAEYNRRVPPDRRVEIEAQLVDELLVNLKAGSVPSADAGRGTVVRSDGIETPLLQLVMTRLWAAELEQGSRVLRSQTLHQLGGARQIASTHLDSVMTDLSEGQREMAAAIFRYLVTPSGMKIAHSVDDLADYADVAPGAMQVVLERLASGRDRVLRAVMPPARSPEPPRYEIFHDVMAPAVLDWRRRYVTRREQEGLVKAKQEAEAKHRATRRRLRLSRILSAALGLLLVVTGVLLWRVNQGEKEVAQQALLAEHRDKLASDPADSLRAAVAAYDKIANPEAESAVRIAADADTELLRLNADAGPLWSSKFSADGTMLLTAGTDGVAKLYDSSSGELLRTFQPKDSAERPRLSQAEFSRDGDLVVTVTEAGGVRLFDTATGEERGLVTQGDPSMLVYWGEQAGRAVLLVSDGSGPAQLWDAQRRVVVHDYGTSAWAAALSADGSYVVAIENLDWPKFRIDVWDTNSERLIERSKVLRGSASTPRFVGTDARHVALLWQQEDANRWHPVFWEWRQGPKAFHTMEVGSRQSAFLAVSGDGRYVAVPLDKAVRVYDGDTRKQVGSTPEASDWLNASVSLSASGRWLATAGNDGRAQIWRANRENNEPVAELVGHRSGVSDVQFDPTTLGHFATASYDGTARTWQVAERSILYGTGGWILDASQSADGQHLATGQDDGLVTVYARTGDSGWEYAQETTIDWCGTVFGADFTPAGDKIVVAGTESWAPEVWDWRKGTYASLETGDKTIFSFAVANRGGRVAAVDTDGRILVWDLETEKIVARISKPANGPRAVVVESVPESGLFAAGYSDGTISVWDPEHPGRPVRSLNAVGAGIRALDFSRDGAFLVALADDHAIRVWRMSDNTLVQTLLGPATTNSDAAFNGDGTLLAVSAADGAVHIWRWAENHKIAVLHRHGDAVNSVEFTADGELLTASDDSTVAIFPCSTCGDFPALLGEARRRIDSRR
jgi:WD40 repeat protein